jgi:hypothetical protein
MDRRWVPQGFVVGFTMRTSNQDRFQHPDDPEVVRTANPVTDVNVELPRIFIRRGIPDPLVPSRGTFSSPRP